MNYDRDQSPAKLSARQIAQARALARAHFLRRPEDETCDLVWFVFRSIFPTKKLPPVAEKARSVEQLPFFLVMLAVVHERTEWLKEQIEQGRKESTEAATQVLAEMRRRLSGAI